MHQLYAQAVVLVLCVAATAFGFSFERLTFMPAARAFSRFAERPYLPLAAIALAVVLLRVAFLPWYPAPEALMHDELSVILGAKTFTLGRMTNPPHPMWVHFETFHVLQQPTYMTIYPPAQPALLATGILLGHPWVAVLVSAALMCAAFVWMLRAWFSPEWALIGGILLLAKIGVFSYWTNSYWGGTLAAFAAAIIVGSASRIWFQKVAQPRYGWLLGAGAAILLNRRPLEGSLLAAGIGMLLTYWLFRKADQPRMAQFLRIASPIAVVLLPCAVLVGYYNSRVTGSPLVVPYVKGIETYGIARHLIWLKAAPEPVYRNQEFREFYETEYAAFIKRRSHPISSLAFSAQWLWLSYLGPSLTIAVLAIPWVLRRRRLLPVVVILCGNLLVNVTETWIFPHYLAPQFPLFWILLVECLVFFAAWRPPWGRCLMVASMAGCVLLEPAIAAYWDIHPGQNHSWERPSIAARIGSIPGKHLVLVHYLRGHNVNEEWVYNDPDIDASRIVWARSLDADQNSALLRYFAGWHVWQLDVGDKVRSLQELQTTSVPLRDPHAFWGGG